MPPLHVPDPALHALLLALQPALPPATVLCGLSLNSDPSTPPIAWTLSRPPGRPQLRRAPLFPAFSLALHAPERRRAEYLAGRQCAALALRYAGRPGPSPFLVRTPSGAPGWPAGWTGSVTHAGGLVLAVAGRAPVQLGLDIEPLPPPPGLSIPELRLHVLRESAFKAHESPSPFDPGTYAVHSGPGLAAQITTPTHSTPLRAFWTQTPDFLAALTLGPSLRSPS